MKVSKVLRISKLRYFLAIGLGSGISPISPGTIGSLASILIWLILIQFSFILYFILIILSIILGIYICYRTENDIQVHDHKSIVWDEFVGMWITMMTLPVNNCQWVAIGFVLFRILDVWKPWPICWFDRNISGGIGIMLDDIMAGLAAEAIILCLERGL